MTVTHALEVGYERGRVRNIGGCWDFAATWGTVLEGVGEEVAAGKVGTVKCEAKDYDGSGRDVYSVMLEDTNGRTETAHYLVGAKPFGIERDWDDAADTFNDRGDA